MSRGAGRHEGHEAVPRIGLVLGAGGITGFAYHSGVLSALERVTGWDPRTADVIVGTSAGAGVGAMLRGGVPVAAVLAHLLTAPSNPETMARLRVLSGREAQGSNWLWFAPGSPRLLLRELSRPWRTRPSRVAVSLLPNGRIPTDYLGDRVRQLHGQDWPEQAFLACALRLDDGQRVVFGASDVAPEIDIDVGTAVEASSAIPAFFRPVRIGGDRYVDGGVHSPTNADLVAAMDLDLVVVVSPMSGEGSAGLRSLDAVSRIASAACLRRELSELRGVGRELLVLEPDRDEIRAMGPIYMDPTRLIPTVLQSGSSTLSKLASEGDTPALTMLRRAAELVTSPPAVPYPSTTIPRAS